jgi:anti-anti-sigma factor
MDELSEPVASVRSRGPDHETVIELRGELDTVSAESVRLVVDEVLTDERDGIVFELQDLTFVDSSGIAVLIHAANRVPMVTLRHANEIVRRIIEITGLTETFIVDP